MKEKHKNDCKCPYNDLYQSRKICVFQKVRCKETIRSIRSNTNWGLLRSFNSALTDWNSLPEDMRCPPYNAFKISLLKNFKSQ